MEIRSISGGAHFSLLFSLHLSFLGTRGRRDSVSLLRQALVGADKPADQTADFLKVSIEAHELSAAEPVGAM